MTLMTHTIVDTLAAVTLQRAVIGITVVVLIGPVDHVAETSEVRGTLHTQAGAILTPLLPETIIRDPNDKQAYQDQDLFQGLLKEFRRRVENLWQIQNPSSQMTAEEG